MDTADRRLTQIGRSLGLVGESQFSHFEAKMRRIDAVAEALSTVKIRLGSKEAEVLAEFGVLISETTVLSSLVRRPEFTVEALERVLPASIVDGCSGEELGVPLNDVKYSGYVENQRTLVERLSGLKNRAIPTDCDFTALSGLSGELVEKLTRIRPETVGQAGRIAGMTPAALNILTISVELHDRRAKNV